MNNGTYQAAVLRTYMGSQEPREKLSLSALGLTGEASEVADHLKKVLYHGHALDPDHLIEELGDLLWYVCLACDALECSLGEVMQRNVEKLRRRYPGGFDPERSIHRASSE